MTNIKNTASPAGAKQNSRAENDDENVRRTRRAFARTKKLEYKTNPVRFVRAFRIASRIAIRVHGPNEKRFLVDTA
jgi:hypothetical protein